MKRILFLITFALLLPMFSLSVSADEVGGGYVNEFFEALPDGIKEKIGGEENILNSVGIEALLGEIISQISGQGSQISAFFACLTAIFILSAASSFSHSATGDMASRVINIVGAVLIYGRISALFTSVSQSIEEICTFFASLIPITSAVSAMSGASLTANTQASGMYLILTLFSGGGGRLLSLLSAFSLALALSGSLGGETATRILRGFKSLFGWTVGILTALISGVIALQTVISSASDSAVLRTARYMTTSLVPVVGSTVSSALSTLSGGLSYARSVIGGGAIGAILLLALSPLVMLLLYRLALSLCLSLSEMLGVQSGTFSSFRFSLDAITSLYALMSISFILQLILFIKVGSLLV